MQYKQNIKVPFLINLIKNVSEKGLVH